MVEWSWISPSAVGLGPQSDTYLKEYLSQNVWSSSTRKMSLEMHYNYFQSLGIQGIVREGSSYTTPERTRNWIWNIPVLKNSVYFLVILCSLPWLQTDSDIYKVYENLLTSPLNTLSNTRKSQVIRTTKIQGQRRKQQYIPMDICSYCLLKSLCGFVVFVS